VDQVCKGMNKIVLNETEIRDIKAISMSLVSEYSSAEDSEFLRMARIYAHELPQRLRRSLNDFMTIEKGRGAYIISGYEIDPEKVGPTPKHWKENPDRSRVLEEEMLLVLLGSLLGDVFGWSTQQDGRIVHDLMPIKGDENQQIGTGSEQLIWWHNEDAFHPYRGDYIGMMCFRNPDKVATTIGCIDQVTLNDEILKLLFEPRFVIWPDESHQEKNSHRRASGLSESSHDVFSAYERIQRMKTMPEKLSVLFGSPSSPYLRIDPYFMDPLDNDPEAKEAIECFSRSMDAVMQDWVLEPGDFIFIDNYRTVHGRKPFKARYDGKDRWLKRINITKDLRKSRDSRTSCTDRLIS
jgi:Fe(II)/alpha-ketoglutarate-dependent arginine beta-hydroxylase